MDGAEDGHDGGGSLRWLLTYADMITLLMAFFIMLYSMSILNMNKFRQVAVSIRSGFGGFSSGQGSSIVGKGVGFTVEPSQMAGDVAGVPWQVVQKVQKLIKEKKLAKSVKLRADERGLIISVVTDKMLFPKGQAELSPHAKEIVNALADAVRSISNPIRVEGHTCNLPVTSGKYPSNWELSTARATAVVRYLIEESWLPPDRLSAARYADSKPLVPNVREVNRAQNRRVDIVILRTDYPYER